MNAIILFTLSLLIGYVLSHYVSKPVVKNGKPVPNRLPRIKIKNFEILPCLRIHFKHKTYWVHHWVYLSVLIGVSFIALDGIGQLLALKGAAFGGILQGLRYPDRFKFRHPPLHRS